MSEAETGFAPIPGGKLYYEVEGDGPAVTLVHAGVAHLRMWDAQVAAWKDRYRVIRYDERGFGRTVVEDVPYMNAEDLRLLLDHLGVASTHLVGNSRGGMIAIDFTLLHSERVKSLTLVASGVGGFNVDDPRLLDAWPEMEKAEEAHNWEPLVEMETKIWTDGPGQPVDRVDPEVRRKMVQWNMESYRAEQQANQIKRLDPLAAERLAEINVPTFVMWGMLDELGAIKSGEKLAAEIPGARSHVFEDVAHMISLERPEEFNKLVGDFIDDAGR